MARDRGHVNRMLLGVRLPGPVPPGAKLFREGQEVGVITSATLSPRLGAIALAYLRRGSQEPGTAFVVDPGADGRRAVIGERGA